MEWLILTAIAAGVAASVTLLFGFSGCDRVFGLHRDAHPPDNLTAVALSSSEIQLSWMPESSYDLFEFERTPEGGAAFILPNKVHTSPFADTGLEADATYFYRARTIADDETSQWTDQVSAKTKPVEITPVVFEPSFETSLPLDDAALEGWCIVQRIEAARLLRGGTQFRLTVSGSTGADLRLTRIFVSRVAASGNAYDSAADITLVASNILIPAGMAPAGMTLPPVAYALDPDQPLLVAFDISPMNLGMVRHAAPVASTDASAFLGTGSSTAPRQEAASAVRSAGYVPVPRLYLVLKIEVA